LAAAALSWASMDSIRLLSIPPMFIFTSPFLALMRCENGMQANSGLQNISAKATFLVEEAVKPGSI
jgi:hypothetical protein